MRPSIVWFWLLCLLLIFVIQVFCKNNNNMQFCVWRCFCTFLWRSVDDRHMYGCEKSRTVKGLCVITAQSCSSVCMMYTDWQSVKHVLDHLQFIYQTLLSCTKPKLWLNVHLLILCFFTLLHFLLFPTLWLLRRFTE